MEVFRQLHESAQRGQFQGEKAAGRADRSAKNLVIKSAALIGTVASGLWLGAIGSNLANESPLAKKIAHFLATEEIQIENLMSDMPEDIRHAVMEAILSLGH
jgi:hypothetical protein